MNNESLHALINFRASKVLLESFDRVCFLSGKTRTQVLSEMMRQRVLTVGSKLDQRAANDRAINERLKTALEAQSAKPMSDGPRRWSNEVLNRLKPFSSPEFDQGR